MELLLLSYTFNWLFSLFVIAAAKTLLNKKADVKVRGTLLLLYLSPSLTFPPSLHFLG